MKQTALSIQTINELRDCYDTHAQKFSSTRKKTRPEMEYVAQALIWLSRSLQRPLHIVELWCGDGRLLRAIQEKYPDAIASYTGVDISNELLTIAHKNTKANTSIKRIHNDMIGYLEQQQTESIDIIITMASYQHLPDHTSRSQFLNQVYRTLSYQGQRISIDRSRSQWMIQKHYQPILQSLKKYITTLWKRERNNLMIPFTDKGETHYRLYHIQTIYEIKKRLQRHHLELSERSYSSQKGDFHQNIIRARNICCIITKTIYSQ